MQLVGKAHVYGDNIDTDRIIPGKHTKTLNLDDLAAHALEDLDPEFRVRMQPGDILVAGHNFGCGSSREQAPVALKAVGISVVIAKSFARLFYRNAINVGLPLVEVENHEIESGHQVQVDLEKGWVLDKTTQRSYRAIEMPQVMVDILNEGGLVNYLNRFGDYRIEE
jgi:3-isopropylmalate/(R)-2-methylmalate dehydratase small subunit